MRFKRLSVEAFGGLEGLDSGESPLPGVVVVQGPNESGKSTFFNFLTTLLYGFYPASRDGNPFTPWAGGDASGSARIVLDDGEEVEVRRRLLSSPTGTLVRGDRSEELRNRTLPFAEHVPLSVFRQVFALTLAELAALEGESWARVQDRLVTGMGASDLRAPRAVAEELEEEAGQLWRPSLRGNQKVRQLGERARELAVRRRAAAETDRELRTAHRELGEVRERLGAARLEREECRLYVERYRALLPIRDQLQRIAGLEDEAGAAEELEGLPPDPAERLAELAATRETLRRKAASVEADLSDARSRIEAFDPGARRVYEARDEIRALVGRIGALEPDRVRIGQLRQEARDLHRRSRSLAGELLDRPLDEVDPSRLHSFVPGPTRRAVDDLRGAEDALRSIDATDASSATLPAPRVLLPGGGVLLLGGLVMVAAGALGDATLLVVAGAVVMAVGTALLGGALALRWVVGERDAGPSSREVPAAAARRRVEEARRALDEALDGIPLLEELRERPPGDLAARLDRLREHEQDRQDRAARAEELEEGVATVVEEVRAAASELDRSVPDDPSAAGHVLSEALREAERARDVAEVAGRELERLEREHDRLESELADVEERERDLRARLESLGDGDPERGVEVARRRVRAADRARQLREELERSHPDLDEITERIRQAEEDGEDWAVDDEALARKKAREEQLVHAIEELSRRAEGLEKDIVHMREHDTADVIEGELESVRARRARLIRERDRLWLMASVVRQADRRFREEHQPDVLRRAGEHLSTMTDGRYERVLVGEDGADATFLLRGPGYPGPVEVGSPVSTGTREQLYLALRLAILDHLDRSGERLPLALDEAFVNWDRARRRRTFELLRSLTGERQIFFFTCHEGMAEELAGEGARRIVLEGPG